MKYGIFLLLLTSLEYTPINATYMENMGKGPVQLTQEDLLSEQNYYHLREQNHIRERNHKKPHDNSSSQGDSSSSSNNGGSGDISPIVLPIP